MNTTTETALRLEIRKQWDVAHDLKCNKKCDCESFGRIGKRCKYPLPEILKNDTTNQRTENE